MGSTFLELYTELAHELDKNGTGRPVTGVDFDHRVANRTGNSAAIQVPGFAQRFGTLNGKIISRDGTPVPDNIRSRVASFIAQMSRI